jgi:hypothetical protein
VVRSRPSCLIVGWRGDNVVHYRDQFFLGLVGLPLQCARGRVASWYGVYGSPLYAAVWNRSHSGVLGSNQQPTVPGVNYPDRL